MSELNAEIRAAEARLAELRTQAADAPVPELPEDLRYWVVSKHVEPDGTVVFSARRAGLFSAAVVTDSAHEFDQLVEKLRAHEARWSANPSSLPDGLRPRRWRTIN